jgi:flagellar hook protein FlgE
MSLLGALNASLTSLTAQSRAVNVISNNIANLSTTGYKSSSVSFSTLVAGTVGGGVLDRIRQDISSQGAVNSTGVGTDLAIQGAGFFVVKDAADAVSYTRAGSFRPNAEGNLVNEAGYILQGWPLDPSGRLPGEAGNTLYTENSANFFVNVSTADISGTASPTSGITAKINLNADVQDVPVLKGSGDTITPVSTTNSTNGSTGLILPTYVGTTAQFAIGATLTIQNATGTRSYTYGGIEQSVDITAAGGLNVASATDDLGFTDGETLTITTGGVTTTYTYRSGTPVASANEFKTLNQLSDLIDGTTGMRSRVLSVNSDAEIYLFVAPDSVANSVTFGGDLEDAGNLGLSNITGASNTFASLAELNDLVQTNLESDGFDSAIASPTVSATLEIFNVDPTDTIKFGSSDADFLAELGLNTTQIAAAYDAEAGTNMASGIVSSDFSRPITIYTSNGGSLNVTLAFKKITSNSSENLWAAELYAPPVSGENVIEGSFANSPELLSYGVISFNGDGTLRSVTGEIATKFDINPTGLASAEEVTLDFGAIGSLEGLTSFASDSRGTLSQNGFPTGQLQSLQIDAEGFVTAVFDNSLTSQVYKLPVAFFSNPNGLLAESGNAFSETTESGSRTLGEVGDSNVGTIVPGALEVSTAEIGGELTRLIVSQQSYSASTNVLRKVTELFDELKNL